MSRKETGDDDEKRNTILNSALRQKGEHRCWGGWGIFSRLTVVRKDYLSAPSEGGKLKRSPKPQQKKTKKKKNKKPHQKKKKHPPQKNPKKPPKTDCVVPAGP